MATTYVGLYSPTDAALELQGESLRAGNGPVAEFTAKVNGFPATLPSGTNLVGSWAFRGNRDGVMVVETEDFSGLAHINTYYAGWLQFEWHPTATGGVPRDQ